MKRVVLLLALLFHLNAWAQWDAFIHQNVFIVQDKGYVSLQCDNVPLGTVLQVLSEELKLNILLAQSLEQPVSMNIHGVPKSDILNYFLEAYRLNIQQQGELFVISPSQTDNLVQGVKTYILKYAIAKDLAETLKSRVQTGFDVRSNALIVYNLEGDSKWLDQLVASVDLPAEQVYIEATIMTASESFTRELGLRFEMDEFSVASLPDHIPLKVAMAAAQENHQTNVIANPKLLTMNLQEAHIKQGKQLAYQENSASGATSVTFQEAALELKVTPMITPDNDIVLNLMVKQDMISHFVVNGQPTIDTKSIQAKVRVKNGETIVLGGIYSSSDNAQSREVPLLARLPLLGRLFQEKRQNEGKDELLIFVTPRVVI